MLWASPTPFSAWLCLRSGIQLWTPCASGLLWSESFIRPAACQLSFDCFHTRLYHS